jgi:hypothetical protein
MDPHKYFIQTASSSKREALINRLILGATGEFLESGVMPPHSKSKTSFLVHLIIGRLINNMAWSNALYGSPSYQPRDGALRIAGANHEVVRFSSRGLSACGGLPTVSAIPQVPNHEVVEFTPHRLVIIFGQSGVTVCQQ